MRADLTTVWFIEYSVPGCVTKRTSGPFIDRKEANIQLGFLKKSARVSSSEVISRERHSGDFELPSG